MNLDGDILAVEQFYRVVNVSRKILEGKILAVADKSAKISPLQNFVLYGNLHSKS